MKEGRRKGGEKRKEGRKGRKEERKGRKERGKENKILLSLSVLVWIWVRCGSCVT
jgi:hypothetical protein